MTGDLPFAEIEQNEESRTRDDVQPAAHDDLPLPTVAPQQGHFGFTLRELIIVGAWVLAFALSFVPGAGTILDITSTVWTMNGAWVLTIGVPTAATFLIVLRRLSPDGIRRVGSLGIDQFASVAYSVAAVSWVVLLWQQVVLVGATRQSLAITWPAWGEIVVMLALVVVTVFAALIPALREDFQGRMETLAHRNADPVRPVFSKPRPVRARGSISDPQSADDVDPGLLHENEVPAATHVSGSASGAPALAAPGYIPEQHRESFLASDALDGAVAPDRDDAVARDDAGRDAASAPLADAPTVAIFETTRLSTAADQPVEEAATQLGTEAAVDAETETEAAVEADVAAEAHVPADTATEAEADAEADTDAETDTETGLINPSDTMTQVLGELLEPSPAEDVATHAVDVPAAGRRSAAAPAAGAQPQPFWALAPDVRPVHDARGDEIFRIGPDAWILVLEDRGGAFVVRHDDGRVGYLHDTEKMTRG